MYFAFSIYILLMHSHRVTGSIHGVLQAASCQRSLPQYPGVSQASSHPSNLKAADSQSPSPVAVSPVAGAATYRKPQQASLASGSAAQTPQGEAAVGWKVSLPFRG